jgi:hypothetical protein
VLPPLTHHTRYHRKLPTSYSHTLGTYPAPKTPLPSPYCGTHIHNPKITDPLFPEHTRSLTNTIKTPVPLLCIRGVYRHTLVLTNKRMGPHVDSETHLHKCETGASIHPNRSGNYTYGMDNLRLPRPQPLPPPTYCDSNRDRPFTPYPHILGTNPTPSFLFPSPLYNMYTHNPKRIDLLYPEHTKSPNDNKKTPVPRPRHRETCIHTLFLPDMHIGPPRGSRTALHGQET